MSHILNHNRTPFVFRVDRSENWDLFLDADTYIGQGYGPDYDACMSMSVDTDSGDCVTPYGILSDPYHLWGDAKNGSLVLENIGLTGMDNGTVAFDRSTISNSEFISLLNESVLDLSEQGGRMIFRPVGGNNDIFDYGCDIVENDGHTCVRLNGGFYQGFFKSGDGYQVLPTNIGTGWGLDFVMKTDSSLQSDGYTLNDRYPENAGIFFYIGTRAENKWWKYYDVDTVFERIANTYYSDDGYSEGDGYFDELYCGGGYFDNATIEGGGSYWTDNYFRDGYADENAGCGCSACDYAQPYFSDGYKIEPGDVCECSQFYNLTGDYTNGDLPISQDYTPETNGGHSVDQPNVIEIETDNKFLLFDRTCDGVKADNWEEGTTAVISLIKSDEKENNFLLYHRGCGGLRADKTWGSRTNKKYDVYSDLYRNAFGLFVDKDGCVGYKYLVKNCDCEGDDCVPYEILSEKTSAGAVKDGKWTTVHVNIEPVGAVYDECVKNTSALRKMVVSVYVDGMLKLVSKEIPTLNLRKLNDTDDKQEGVPFSISIGGGTQGLADVIYPDFTRLPDTVLPLEREFGGSLFGYVRRFRFYSCPVGLSGIRGNITTL